MAPPLGAGVGEASAHGGRIEGGERGARRRGAGRFHGAACPPLLRFQRGWLVWLALARSAGGSAMRVDTGPGGFAHGGRIEWRMRGLMSPEDAARGRGGGARTAMLAAVRSLELSSARALISCGRACAPRAVDWRVRFIGHSGAGFVCFLAPGGRGWQSCNLEIFVSFGRVYKYSVSMRRTWQRDELNY